MGSEKYSANFKASDKKWGENFTFPLQRSKSLSKRWKTLLEG